MDDFEDDDTLSEIINIKIPENAEQGDYNLSINVAGKESSDAGYITLKVLGKKVNVPITLQSISLSNIPNVEKSSLVNIPSVEKPQVKKPSFSLDEYLPLIDFILIFGIIILVILIIVVQRKRR